MLYHDIREKIWKKLFDKISSNEWNFKAYCQNCVAVILGEKPFECTWECGRRFVSISARNEHERIVHAGVKRYHYFQFDYL